MKKGFNNDKYVKLQSEKIKERIKMYDKLYLEIGGKLFSDNHAERVLPGFVHDSKIKMFQELKDILEIIFCINANDIEKNKIRAEYGITYDIEILNIINNATKLGFKVNSVVITLYNNQKSVDKFIKKLERQNIKTYIHKFTKGYPTDIETIVSEEGYGENEYITTSKKLILVNAPGPCSGKLATCLSQLYHEHKKNVNAGYAKFETFPVWNLPLKHPVNIAYEAATADLKDRNMIDSFHLEKYNIPAINYNRDIETFPIVKTIIKKISNKDVYYSPTDMGVNMVGFCIEDDKIVNESAKKEIVRRYYNELKNYKLGQTDYDTVEKIKILMNELEIDTSYLKVSDVAKEKSKEKNTHLIALELSNKKYITGRETELLSAPSSLVINAIKELSKIPDDIKLLSPKVLEPILKLKTKERKLNLQEVLIALSICSVTNPVIEKALTKLNNLKYTEAHSTFILSENEIKTLKELNINITCEPNFYSNELY